MGNTQGLTQSCLLCGQSSTTAICMHCEANLADLTHQFEFARENLLWHPLVEQHVIGNHCRRLLALADYVYPYNYWVQQFKFNGKTALANLFAARFVDRILTQQTARADALIPIPLHTKRYITRHYNQAYLFAEALTKMINIPTDMNFVKRTVHVPPQSQQSAAGRQKRQYDWFAVDANAKHYRHVILVDDVLTTGKTVDSCCRAIKAAYPDLIIDVWVICLRIFTKH